MFCSSCGLEKPANTDNFEWRNDVNSYRRVCRECIKGQRKAYYTKHKKTIKEKAAQYRSENRDRIIEYMKDYNSREDVKSRAVEYRKNNRKLLRKKEAEWRKKNPEKAKELARRKHKKRLQNPMIKLRYNISRGINLALKRQGSSKAGDSIMNHLPFRLDDLKKHLENRFESWMSWANYGPYIASTWDDDDQETWTWQIDHIIPQSETPYDSMTHDNFKKCWNLNNLRPLSSKTNCLDGCNRTRHKGKK